MSFEHSLLTGHPDQIDSSLVTADYKRFCDSDCCDSDCYDSDCYDSDCYDSDFCDSEVNVIFRLGFLLSHLRFFLACLLSEISFSALVII